MRRWKIYGLLCVLWSSFFILSALTVVDAQYYPYPRDRYANDRPPPPPSPPPRRVYPRPCWNCGQSYPSDVPSCPYCYSPREKPR
jgi:hypothetical protein